MFQIDTPSVYKVPFITVFQILLMSSIIENFDKNLFLVFRKLFDINKSDWRDDLTINEIIGWDSISAIKFFNELENEFQISFDPDDLFEVKNIENIKKLIMKKTENN